MTLFYNGIQYEVEEESEDIDPINIPEVEFKNDKSIIQGNSTRFEEAYWTYKATDLFLDECIKRKMLLRVPIIPSHKLFMSIHERMKEMGYLFKTITLQRKFQNLKKHYTILREEKQQKQSPSSKASFWPFYRKMSILFSDEDSSSETAEELTTPKRRKLIHKQPKQEITRKVAESKLEATITQMVLKENPPSMISILSSNKKNNFLLKKNQRKKIKLLKEKMLALEERRTVAMEKILLELQKSNDIKREILDVNIQIFEISRDLG